MERTIVELIFKSNTYVLCDFYFILIYFMLDLHQRYQQQIKRALYAKEKNREIMIYKLLVFDNEIHCRPRMFNFTKKK